MSLIPDETLNLQTKTYLFPHSIFLAILSQIYVFEAILIAAIIGIVENIILMSHKNTTFQ